MKQGRFVSTRPMNLSFCFFPKKENGGGTIQLERKEKKAISRSGSVIARFFLPVRVGGLNFVQPRSKAFLVPHYAFFYMFVNINMLYILRFAYLVP